MSNKAGPIETEILKRDTILAESGEENRSFILQHTVNCLLGIVRLCVLIYCLFVCAAHILILSKYDLNAPQIINIVMELMICIFVVHDALAAGGWRPGVANSLWLIKFAKLIPYYSFKQYYTSIPKNYLRAVLFLFVSSINNSNDTYTSLQNIRILNVALVALSILFIAIGYIGAIKNKLMSFYTDWIIENYKNYDSVQPIKYETNTWFGWASMVFNILFFLFAIAAYSVIIATSAESLELFVIIACVAKMLLFVLIIAYLFMHRKVITEVNWCSVFILLLSLNASLNLFYDFKSDIPLNEYCIYAWLALLLIECVRFLCIIFLYFKSMYRYYTPFTLFCTNIIENIHFWIIKQGITKIGLILILLALPFLIITLTYDWFIIDMRFTPFFDFETPLKFKFFDVSEYWDIFEEIWDEVDALLDVVRNFDMPDTAMCVIILAAFAGILGGGLLPGGGTAAATFYQAKRVLKIAKRIAEMFKKIYDTVKSLIDKIKAIYEKLEGMIKRVQQFVALLEQIGPKYIGITSVAGLFGFILIPITTVILILYISFFNRSLRFNSFQVSAHSQHWLWLLFSGYLLLLNIANLCVIMSLQKLLTEIFVFETVVFETDVLTSDGYDALFAVHILIIVGLALFICDRLFIKFCNQSKCYQWKKPEQLHSYCKCKADTPTIQALIGYLIEYHQWNSDKMSFEDMKESIKYKDGLESETQEIIDIMLGVTWSCIKYNRFDQNMQITKKEWEYFLTSYKIASFPWTQPASARNTTIQNKLKTTIDEIFASNDNIAYYQFHEHGKDDIVTLNLIGCKLIIAHLRGIDEEKIKVISENDIAVKIFMNLSQKQLNHLLTRFDEKTWNLIIAKDVIHDIDEEYEDHYYSYNNNSPKRHTHIKPNNSSDIDGENETKQSEIELQTMENNHALPPNWKKIINEEGLVYYHNEKYSKTQWDRPTEDDTFEVKEETQIEEKEQELPPNWEQIQNEEGMIYYHNSVLNQTQWERPTQIDTAETKDEKDTQSSDEEDNENELPTFWRAITNNGGMMYYHNDNTNKTQWEKPLKPETKTFQTQTMKVEEIKEEMQNTSVATQTSFSMNGAFERKIMYLLFFQMAFNDILNKKNTFKHETNERKDDRAMEEDEAILIALIDDEWLRLNAAVIIAMNSDNEDKNYNPTKFAPERVLHMLNEKDKIVELGYLNISPQWIAYLNKALVEYNNKYNTDKLILELPKRQHFETWFIYIILFLLVSIWSCYSVVNYEFMSLKYEPTMQLINSVNALIKSKEGLVTEWNVTNFDSFTDFYDVSDDQFYDCDIGSIFTLVINPLKKYNSFNNFMSAMLDGFTMSDIPLIELLDELDIDVSSLGVEAMGEIDGLEGIDISTIEGINGVDGLEGIDGFNGIDINSVFEIDSNVNFVQFPMIEVNTWPPITLWFYGNWYFILLFAPLFSLVLVFSLFIYGCIQNRKKQNGIEINKQLYSVIIIFAGFCGLEFVLSLGSVVSVVSTYLPNSVVQIKYESGYYNMIFCNLVIMLVGGMIFIDILVGEHIPLLSKIFKRTTTRAHSSTHMQAESKDIYIE